MPTGLSSLKRHHDPTVVAELAAVWAEGGWPCEVDDSGVRLTAPFSAPSAGQPPWAVYRMTVTSATALAMGTATPSTVRVVCAAPPPKPTRTPAAPVRIRCSAAW